MKNMNCALCKKINKSSFECYLLVPYPTCFLCATKKVSIKEISFPSSRPAQCVKETDRYNAEACRLYINALSEHDILKLCAPETDRNTEETSICKAEDPSKYAGNFFPNSKLLSSLAAQDPDDSAIEKVSENPEEDFRLQITDHSKDLKILLAESMNEAMNDEPVGVSENPEEDFRLQITDHSKDLKILLAESMNEAMNDEPVGVSENPEEDFRLQITDHSKDLKILLAESMNEAMNDEQVGVLEEQSNKEFHMKENLSKTATESNCEKPISEVKVLNGTSKNTELLEKASKDSVTPSDINQQQKEESAGVRSRNIEQLEKATKDMEVTITARKFDEDKWIKESEAFNNFFEALTPSCTLPDLTGNQGKDLEESPKLFVPFAMEGDYDPTLEGKDFTPPEPLKNLEYESEYASSPIDMLYPQFVRDLENVIDLYRVANNPAYMEEFAAIGTRLKHCLDYLHERMESISRMNLALESDLSRLRRMAPGMTAERIRSLIDSIQSNISETDSLCGVEFYIENVTISLENFDKDQYIKEIYKQLKISRAVYAVHNFERKQIFGRVTLSDDNILVFSLTTKYINMDCATVWLKDLKKCFNHSEDKIFILYYIHDEGYTMEFIEPTENPLTHQFIKICTGECGPTYKNASLNKPKDTEESRGSYPEIEVFEYMSNERPRKGPVDYYLGENWVTCLPKERVVIGSKHGAFRIAKIGNIKQDLISVVGKVRSKIKVQSNDSYVLERTVEWEGDLIIESGFSLKIISGIRG